MQDKIIYWQLTTFVTSFVAMAAAGFVVCRVLRWFLDKGVPRPTAPRTIGRADPTLADDEIIVACTNNSGQGSFGPVTVRRGTTLGGFFRELMGHQPYEDFLVRVNRLPTQPDYVLRHWDKVSITPTKFEYSPNRSKG